jgi:hypothetical protein
MRGNTATISVTEFRAEWLSHRPFSHICTHFTITRDQAVRLRLLWDLPPRNDRRLRFKPVRSEIRDPTPSEIADACREIQAMWDDRTRAERCVNKSKPVELRPIDTSDEARDAMRWFVEDE